MERRNWGKFEYLVYRNGRAHGQLSDRMGKLAVEKDQGLADALSELKTQQEELISSLLNTNHALRLKALLSQDIENFQFWLKNSVESHHSDILAFGELWSARLLSAVLNERVCPSYHLDSNYLQLQ